MGAQTENYEVTRILDALAEGDRAAVDQLFPLFYDQFHEMARHYLSQERSGHTLQPTALVHESYLRLVEQNRMRFQNRSHFIALGAVMMRRALVEHARSRKRRKRGGDVIQVDFIEDMAPSMVDLVDLIAFDRALARLQELDSRQARIVELRFFGGLSVEEVAEVLGVSKRTIEGDWHMARAWLRRELAEVGSCL